jgi:putative transposase
MGTVTRTEQIQFKSKEISALAHASKNLYNAANFILRKRFFENQKLYQEKKEKGKGIFYCKTEKHPEDGLYEMFKDTDLYKALPAQTAQWTLKKLCANWTSYFKNHARWLKEFKANPVKFPVKTKKMPDGTVITKRNSLGHPLRDDEPNIPKYKHKDGEYILVFTNQQCKIIDGIIKFPKVVTDKIKTRLSDDTDLREVRIVPKGVNYVCEIVYDKEINPSELSFGRIIGIDPNVGNLVAIANNFGAEPYVVKGSIAQQMNHYYNQENARLRSIYDKAGIRFGHKLERLNWKRNNKFKDHFHKISRDIINYCIENNVDTIVIGKNEGWKDGVNLGKKNNQNFVPIPIARLIEMVKYKAEEVGINVVLQQESHTSVCSFLDLESIEHHDKYVGKRGTSTKKHPVYFNTSTGKKIPAHRGLFMSSTGQIINSDINGALNIIRKAFPNAFANGIQGVGLHPYRCYV